MSEVQYLVTTVGLGHEEMFALAKRMNFDGDAIIRSQCGREGGIRPWSLGGHELLTVEADDTGTSTNRNKLASLATGSYIAFLDDDVRLPDGYSEGISRAFEELKADGLRRTLDGERSRADLPYGRRLSWKHISSGTCNPYFFRRSSLKGKGLSFDENVGPGRDVSCGEDSLFLKSALAHRLRIFSAGQGPSAWLSAERPSTWFHGHDAQFFFSKGFIYRRLYPCLYPLFLLRASLRWKAEELTVWQRLKLMFSGAREEGRVSRTGTEPSMAPYRKYRGDQPTPRILVMSHLPLSRSEANGRTLLGLLSCFSGKDILNFHISGNPSSPCCRSFFRMSDKDAVRSFFGMNGGREEEPSSVLAQKPRRRIPKSMATMLLRDLAWRAARPLTKSLCSWLKRERPDVILLLSSDLPAFAEVAGRISRELKIPTVHFNTEEYLLKDYDFLSGGHARGERTLLSRIYSKRINKVYSDAYRDSCVVHLTEALLKEYEAITNPRKSVWIGNSSSLKPVARNVGPIREVFYFGNLDHLRWSGLIQIYESLLGNGFSGKFHVFGKGDPEAIGRLSEAGIAYEGFLPYEAVMERVSREADLLVHCESFEPYFALDGKNAFSTKIPDMLALGLPCLFYAPRSYRFINYLSQNGAHFVATSREELDSVARRLVHEPFPHGCLEREGNVALAKRYHSPKTNGERFLGIVFQALEGLER